MQNDPLLPKLNGTESIRRGAGRLFFCTLTEKRSWKDTSGLSSTSFERHHKTLRSPFSLMQKYEQNVLFTWTTRTKSTFHFLHGCSVQVHQARPRNNRLRLFLSRLLKEVRLFVTTGTLVFAMTPFVKTGGSISVPAAEEIIEQRIKKIASPASGQSVVETQANQARETSIAAKKGPRSIMGDSRKRKAHEFPEVPSFRRGFVWLNRFSNNDLSHVRVGASFAYRSHCRGRDETDAVTLPLHQYYIKFINASIST